MGLLDKLWDDVVAGPQPDKGLGRLRKEKLSINIDASGIDEDRTLVFHRRRSAEFQYSQGETRRVTQSIAIVKPPVIRPFGLDESLPSTPSGSSVPLSPSLTSPQFRSKDNSWRSVFHSGGNKDMDRNSSAKFDEAHPNSPTVYDWVVISVLDR
ncbi:hypothetical protein O6H91_19G006000 [Diphasiastrum complanatum]|uniref:Uncharacterized protein n=2 Tax=Diphasiastrum complanatum TaxID=34168 RepID=A0ACC2ASC7_DIPCM|nr:hypothetical protein O6H91_19G005700 [Diphasiastrum complanatum]KAJ7520439.1 hypothetical protein O6H91_19G006000 [Diphasiastrum complanatum]